MSLKFKNSLLAAWSWSAKIKSFIKVKRVDKFYSIAEWKALKKYERKLMVKTELIWWKKLRITRSNRLRVSYKRLPWIILHSLQEYTEVFYIKKNFLKNFAIFTGKHLCWSLFLIKLKASSCKRLLLYYLELYFISIRNEAQDIVNRKNFGFHYLRSLILKLFKVLIQVWFTRSEVELDAW